VTSGERYVRLTSDKHIHVLDFNPHHVRLEISRTGAQDTSRIRSGGGKEGSVQVVHGPTLLKHEGELNPWRKRVCTELPFVHTISKDPYSITGAMIDGKRIIGVEVLFISCVYKGND
jgi:hypothetical protein